MRSSTTLVNSRPISVAAVPYNELVSKGVADNCTARHGTTQHVTVRHDTARHGTARHSTARYGMTQHGTVAATECYSNKKLDVRAN